MPYIDPEAQAYDLFKEKIRIICEHNWCFMEPDDRISEASIVFLIVLRTFSTSDGRFWQNYLELLEKHMRSLQTYYRTSSCRLSLNRSVHSADNTAYPYSFQDILPAPGPDHTAKHIYRFLTTLPARQQRIVYSLMDGKTRQYVCQKEKLALSELRHELQSVIEDYRDYAMSAEYEDF